MANSVTGFIFGVLTVIIVGAAIYLYIDFTKSETRVADYDAGVSGNTYIYDEGDEAAKEAINESIGESLPDDVVPTGNTFITGKLCFPSQFLPEGEIVAKNISTTEIISIDFDGTTSEYKIGVEPGTYYVRYQAHASGGEDYTSGYYTKCGIESTSEVCNADDGHELIPVEVSQGEIIGGIDLCDFYYQEEPEF